MSRKVRPLAAEFLEDRAVPASVRSIDGSGNNALHPDWGTAGSAFLRLAPAAYADGLSAPAGAARPGARAVSNAVSDQGDQEVLSDRLLSAMVYAWGQFLDHDLDLTRSGTTESLPVSIPTGDPTFDPAGTGTQTMSFTRSAAAAGTGVTTPRQQVNDVTSWLDGSMVYGSDAATANALRTLSGGKLKTSAGNLLPLSGGFFQAGDSRANENPELTSLQTVFVREHNRLADQFAKQTPGLTDEQLYQKARAWVIAELQAITFNEWLPTVLGAGAVPAYRGYDPAANPGISTEFATAAYRLGHSMLADDIQFLGNDGRPVRDGVSLGEAFFNPALVSGTGIEPLLKYLASDPMSEVDTKVVDGVRNLLLAVPGATVKLDLAALNVQRGRDHGLADYNATRAAYGLPKVTSFAQITRDPAMQAKLKALYGTVDNIDLWVGGLAEDHVPGGSVGPLFRAIIAEQFGRLRAADSFWYQKMFAGADLAALNNTHLSDVIRRNTTLTTVQANPFVFQVQISGTVFGDGNRDGRRNGPERGAAGRTVDVTDVDTGEVVATVTTDAQGRYKAGVADGLRTGRYAARVRLNPGELSTAPAGRVFAVTGGDVTFNGVDLGLAPGTPTPPPPAPPPGPPRPHSHGRTAGVAPPLAGDEGLVPVGAVRLRR